MAEIAVRIEAKSWRAVPKIAALIRRAARAALATVPRGTGSVSVLLADDEEIRRLNAEFRGKDSATNVLSFPAAEIPGDPEPVLGDIVLAFETCLREAEAERKTIEAHLAHLVVHGVLHLTGFDHETEKEAEAMEGRERAILASLGIADPYAIAERAAS